MKNNIIFFFLGRLNGQNLPIIFVLRRRESSYLNLSGTMSNTTMVNLSLFYETTLQEVEGRREEIRHIKFRGFLEFDFVGGL